jgi:radical SAM superfamily enzyme YgiQ (UPF0313 family)
MMQQDDNFIEYCNSIKSNIISHKLLLIQMPQIEVDVINKDIAEVNGYYTFPPTGLQYVYEEIKHRDIEIEILDLNLEILRNFKDNTNFNPTNWISILEEKISNFTPTLIGVSCLFDFSIKYFLEVLEYLKSNSHAIVIAGGVISTFEWGSILNKSLAHFVIKGEAEGKINFLLDYITNNNTNSPMSRSIYYKLNNKLYETIGNHNFVDFNTDLIESYNLLDILDYSKYGSLNPFSRTVDGILRFAVIQRNRGCRARCTFCSVEKIMGKGARVRDFRSVIKEMEYLVTKKGINHFEWLDDDLLFNINDFRMLLKTIIDKKWDITWSANNGLIASAVNEETLKLINDSGCIGFKIGVETGSKEMLKDVRKPASLNSFLNLSNMLIKYPNIFVGGNIILGLPGEKFYMLMDTFHFSIKMNYDWAVFTTCQAIRGASAFSEMGEYFESQIENKGGKAHNFIPTRTSKKGYIETNNNIKKGLDIFTIDKDEIASGEQIQEIWFTFNLIVNFIFNKNLYEDGKPSKFIGWVEKARKAYPYNPYMLFFLAVAYKIDNNLKLSNERYILAIDKINSDMFWRDKLSEFGLMEFINNFNKLVGTSDIFNSLENIRKFIKNKLEIMDVFIDTKEKN